MRLLTRRTLRICAAVLLGIVVLGAWFLLPRSRITQENFDRIQKGMTYDDVSAILGDPTPLLANPLVSGSWEEAWSDGPSTIHVNFKTFNGQVVGKALHLATAWETLTWYAKKGAAKAGVKWN